MGVTSFPQAGSPAHAETGGLGRGHQPVDGDRQTFHDLGESISEAGEQLGEWLRKGRGPGE